MVTAERYVIILEKIEEERRADAALFLSGCFSLPPSSTRGIVASAPIALLPSLPKPKAEAVLSELAATLPLGVKLRLAGEGEASRLSRLQWPRPPRVYGRDLNDFIDEGDCYDIECPICGGQIRVCREGESARAFVVSGTERKDEPPPPLPAASDKDPLFSGIKPVASAASNYASLRSLQAGDTGFWLEHDDQHSVPPAKPGLPEAPVEDPALASAVRKGAVRPAAGLAAYMKPGAFAVVVGRTRDNQAVKMVADIMGIGENEARDKCQSLGLCVAKGISLDEAQSLLARFRGVGARARVVKPM